jgi:hypothetical protein
MSATFEPESFYVSFGQVHRHEINGQIFDKDCICEIESFDLDTAQEDALRLFGPKFCMIYRGEAELNMDFYPRGIIKL